MYLPFVPTQEARLDQGNPENPSDRQPFKLMIRKIMSGTTTGITTSEKASASVLPTRVLLEVVSESSIYSNN